MRCSAEDKTGGKGPLYEDKSCPVPSKVDSVDETPSPERMFTYATITFNTSLHRNYSIPGVRLFMQCIMSCDK
jgi:hypothetical protein